jgi:hypothetical protein
MAARGLRSQPHLRSTGRQYPELGTPSQNSWLCASHASHGTCARACNLTKLVPPWQSRSSGSSNVTRAGRRKDARRYAPGFPSPQQRPSGIRSREWILVSEPPSRLANWKRRMRFIKGHHPMRLLTLHLAACRPSMSATGCGPGASCTRIRRRRAGGTPRPVMARTAGSVGSRDWSRSSATRSSS